MEIEPEPYYRTVQDFIEDLQDHSIELDNENTITKKPESGKPTTNSKQQLKKPTTSTTTTPKSATKTTTVSRKRSQTKKTTLKQSSA